jgi:predicted nucleic acid-binding protein
MTLIADTGGLYALYDADDTNHKAVRWIIEQERSPLIVPMAILGELDYLLREFLGIDAELAFLEGVAAGAYLLEPLTKVDLARCRALIAKYRELDLGLADAAVIATAERFRINRVLTVDERDFRAVTPQHGTLRLLPADRDQK